MIEDVLFHLYFRICSTVNVSHTNLATDKFDGLVVKFLADPSATACVICLHLRLTVNSVFPRNLSLCGHHFHLTVIHFHNHSVPVSSAFFHPKFHVDLVSFCLPTPPSRSLPFSSPWLTRAACAGCPCLSVAALWLSWNRQPLFRLVSEPPPLWPPSPRAPTRYRSPPAFLWASCLEFVLVWLVGV